MSGRALCRAKVKKSRQAARSRRNLPTDVMVKAVTMDLSAKAGTVVMMIGNIRRAPRPALVKQSRALTATSSYRIQTDVTVWAVTLVFSAEVDGAVMMIGITRLAMTTAATVYSSLTIGAMASSVILLHSARATYAGVLSKP